MDTFSQLLAAASAAHASNLMNNMMQDDLKCRVVIPQSTIVKICVGSLTWLNPEVAGPFSIFSCVPSSALQAAHNYQAITDEEFLARHLNATEGRGLTEA